MKKHIITLGGEPGGGKTTIRKRLAELLDYETFSTGEFARGLAVERGVTLEEFNETVAKTKELDLLIDSKLQEIESESDRMVVDSHLAFHFIPSAFSVYLHIDPEEAAKRIFNDKHSDLRKKSGDTMESLEEAYRRTQKRIKNHQERYMAHYGIDPYDSSQFDLVIDTTHITPEEVTQKVLSAYKKWLEE